MSTKNAITGTRLPRTAFKRHRVRRRPATRSLGAESLESRKLMAGAVGLTFDNDSAAPAAIRKAVKWTEAQRAQILAELIAGFPDVPHNQFLRFRSSSNAEDSQELTGAGLYDSFSGCIADDTDNDNKGPSHADPNEPDEKGVFRAIEKVFASFYNENAWLERLRHGVREHDTGMALLVHHNFPDLQETANGVVTFKYLRFESRDDRQVSYSASIVTQLGAVSVTNPEGDAIAEEVYADFSPGQTPFISLRTRSTLVPIGGTVMTWESDYRELVQLIARVAEGYANLYPNSRASGN